ncbi:MAG: hypothetical protein CMI67_22555 [Pelagibaca sp.]|nr:hypothetical protein [Pelagibaca sp.]
MAKVDLLKVLNKLSTTLQEDEYLAYNGIEVIEIHLFFNSAIELVNGQMIGHTNIEASILSIERDA